VGNEGGKSPSLTFREKRGQKKWGEKEKNKNGKEGGVKKEKEEVGKYRY